MLQYLIVKENLFGCKEDIGRHNVIDIGIDEMLLKKERLNDKFLTSTGLYFLHFSLF